MRTKDGEEKDVQKEYIIENKKLKNMDSFKEE